MRSGRKWGESRPVRATVRPLGVLCLFLVGAVSLATAQEVAVQGVVRDSTGAVVASATVTARPADAERPVWAAETDSAGRYRIGGLRPGRYRVRARRIGYGEAEQQVQVRRGVVATVDFVLGQQALALEGVTVEAERERARARLEAGTTVRDLAGEEMKVIPGLAEADVLRAVQVLPGVVSTSDFTAAFNVRGGAADQNLILLDGLPIYNPFHLGGLFSVFNADMVARAELMAGGFPARYGGRVSSVLDVESDAGGSGLEADAGVSLLATRLAVGGDVPDALAGPLGLRSGRWRLSARRSYFDQLLKPAFEFPYHLTDLQAFGELWTRGGGRITVTAYTGDDVLDLSRLDPEEFPLRLRWGWGNDVAGIRWRRPVGRGGEVEVRSGYTRFSTAIRFPDFSDTEFSSEIDEALVGADVLLPLSDGLKLGFGAQLNRLAYDNLAASGGTVFQQSEDRGWSGGLYTQMSWRPTPDWLVDAGVRGDGWVPEEAEAVRVLSPRLAVKRFFDDEDGAVKVAVGRYTQFLHSLRDEELPVGIDVWVTAGRRAPHIVSDQVQAGVEWAFTDAWDASLEVYYRTFDGVVTNNFAEDPNDPADDLLAGTGTAYGADLLVRRQAETGLNGWVTVSLLRTWRTFPDTRSGLDPAPDVRYPPIFDRRVDVDLVLRYPLPWALDAGLRWNFGTGLPYTRPLGAYTYFEYGLMDGWVAESSEDDGPPSAVLLGPRNGARYPAYHRLDVSLRRPFEFDWGRLTPYLNVINVYNQKNVLFYFYQYDRTPPVRTGISMFPVLPTIGAEVSF